MSLGPRLSAFLWVRALPALFVGIGLIVRGQRALSAAVAAGALVGLISLMERHRHVLRLMPMARAIGFGAAPVIAVATTAAVSGGDEAPSAGAHGPVVVACWGIMGIGAYLRRKRDRRRVRRIAVLGGADRANMLRDELARAGAGGYEVCGYVDVNLAVVDRPLLHPADDAARAVPVALGGGRLLSLGCLGHLSELRTIVVRDRIDLLLLDSSVPRMPIFDSVLDTCLDLPVRFATSEWLYERLLGHVPIGTINASWFQYVMHPEFWPSSPLSKRLFDIVVAAVLLCALMPLILIVALAIRVLDGAPVFYRQVRLAEGGRTFPIVKFRTMPPDAERTTGAVWSRADEYRSTRIGSLLRRTHVDEIPQLFNVLAGQMSLVGPRPERPEFLGRLVEQVPFYTHRGIVKPGITGWAQVRCGYAGSEVGTAWKLSHDLYYLKRRSVLFDLLIMIETLRIVVSGRQFGAELRADFVLPQAVIQPLQREPATDQRVGGRPDDAC
jgi:exopolysaccharide biosynthesis polyprenyl glycosylphosphotransferase